MDDNEGSVFNEDSDEEYSESTETQESEEQTENADQAEDASKEEPSKDQEQDKADVTEKGTKLDQNPLSRVNQELANERAKIKQYEEVLNNPTLLKNYVTQFENPETQKEKNEEPEMRVEDIQTTEDLQKYQRQQDKKLDSKFKELDTTISSVKSSQRDTVVASRIQSDITTIREQYPELNPKSPTYNKELDTSVGELYEMYDLDPQTKTFRGQVSIKDIAEKVMKAAGSSRKQGSEEAQTTIRDKRSGRAVSGASSTAPDESHMTPGQIIASRIKAARGGR